MKVYIKQSIIGFVLCIAVYNCSGNGYKVKPSDLLEDSIPSRYSIKKDNRRNSICDSIYSGPYTIHFKDTIINGIKYALAINLSEKYTLAFREFSKKWLRNSKMVILTDGVCTTTFDTEDNYIFYEAIYPSPSRLYVFLTSYYETGNPSFKEDDIIEVILKFGGGEILDIEKAKNIWSISSNQLEGDWTYCDQWDVYGEVVFDPEWMKEDGQ